MRIISVDGYKAFHGDMKITPKNGTPFQIVNRDWLYKPEYNCWYGDGRSFSADICEILSEESTISENK